MISRQRAAAVACLLTAAVSLASCSAEEPPSQASEPSTATSAAPIIPEETELPTELSNTPSPSREELADAAEKLAQKPTQRRPERISVAGSTTWQIGRPYHGLFADPDIVRHGGRWYAYATSTAGFHLPTLVSRDLRRWTPLRDGRRAVDALPTVGGWVVQRGRGLGLWAPSVAKVGDGWTAAYSARAATVGGERHNCMGLARGTSPSGPFRPVGRPICSPNAQLGLIDPDIYVDGVGTPWLLWKFSGVPQQRPAGLFVRQLADDGRDFAPGAVTRELLRKDQAWEGRTIENPSMVEFGGVTYLFYSGNSWKTGDYATGYAICDGPSGPCVRPSGGSPFLATASTGNLGPGGASAFVHGKSVRLIYHAWAPGRVGELRRLHVAGLWQRDDGTLEVVHAG